MAISPGEAEKLAAEIERERDRTVRDKSKEIKEKAGHIQVRHLLAGGDLAEVGRHLTQNILLDVKSCDKWIPSIFTEDDQYRRVEVLKRFPQEDPVTWALKILSTRENVTLKDLVESLEKLKDLWILCVDDLHKDIEGHAHVIGTIQSGSNLWPVNLPNALKDDESPYNWIKTKRPDNYKGLKKIILLTYAEDGVHLAKEIKDALMSKSESGHWYLVLTLQDLEMSLLKDNTSIIDVVMQVHFVVPILTPGYEKLYKSKEGDPSSPIDAQYVPLLYSLLFSEYCNKRKNERVRCYLSKEAVPLLCDPKVNSSFKLCPLFQAYAGDIRTLKKNLC